jgi:hypothetical protein
MLNGLELRYRLAELNAIAGPGQAVIQHARQRPGKLHRAQQRPIRFHDAHRAYHRCRCDHPRAAQVERIARLVGHVDALLSHGQRYIRQHERVSRRQHGMTDRPAPRDTPSQSTEVSARQRDVPGNAGRHDCQRTIRNVQTRPPQQPPGQHRLAERHGNRMKCRPLHQRHAVGKAQVAGRHLADRRHALLAERRPEFFRPASAAVGLQAGIDIESIVHDPIQGPQHQIARLAHLSPSPRAMMPRKISLVPPRSE